MRGQLDPVFDSSETDYTASVENAVSQITVTATKNHEAATIAYRDGSNNTLTDADADTEGFQVNLVTGTNKIKVKVTSQNEDKAKTYTITVTRAVSTDATLSGLSLSAGTLAPVFSAGTTIYTATVGNAVSQITVTAETNNEAAAIEYLDVNDNTLTDEDGNTTGLQVNLVVGPNPIKVKVTAQDGVTTQTYTITVTRNGSADVMLSSLSLSEGTLNPVFSVSTTNYTATVGNEVSQITVTVTKNHGSATLVYLDENDNTLTDADESTEGFQVNLVVGTNIIKVKVTAQDDVTTQTCIVTITRAASSDVTSSVQVQEVSHHEHTMIHSHDDYVDHTHRMDHSHMVTLNTGETMEQARQRHLGMWHEENQPNGGSVMYNHDGVGRLAAVSSDEVDDLFANDPADPQIRILHNHSFEHDDGQGYMHTHHYVHGHVSPNPNEECPGLVVCEHEHANHAQQFREHGNHVIGERHVHFWVNGEEGSSHVVEHRDGHNHLLYHTHTNGYSVEIGGVLTDTEHYHRFTHNHSYTDMLHDYSEGGGLPRGISLPVLVRKIGANGFTQKGEHNHNSVSFFSEADDTGGSEMSDAAIVEQTIPLSVDFNGNGVVDFPDFLLFVDVFGSQYDKEKYEIKYDLNVNGEIGFGDFLLFVESFGKTMNHQ